MALSSTSLEAADNRAAYLERVNRASMEALRLVLEMGRQGTSLNRIDDPRVILQETQLKIDQIIAWEAASFFLMDEEDSNLTLALCSPVEAGARMEAVFEHLVEERTLSLVLQRSEHFFIGVDGREVLVHAMNTVSRCRGVFVGIPQEPRKTIPDASLAIFSIMMQATAQTLESYELYRLVRGVNVQLKDKVRCLEAEMTERKRYQERVAHMALHDPLTGLPNRALFIERLERAIERGRRRVDYRFAVLMLDLDRFKQINDTMGHRFGDSILGLMARRIGKCLRSMDTVARLGGDDFVVLLEELSSPREAVVIARRLQKEITQPEVIEDKEFYVTASGGLLVKTRQYSKSDDLMRDAEIALHSAMDQGGAKFKVFTPSMLHRAMHVANVEYDLRTALIHGELFLQYQPIYSLGQDALIGLEALARWNHPERGLVNPDEFIPIAERTGIIHELGKWVLHSACMTMTEWQRSFPHALALFLSVNISGRQLSQPSLADTVRAVLEETGLPAGSLKLEITESSVMENADLALITLRQLKSLGVSLAIDDFGTGYSSLAYLQRFPVDTLKIDRSFISGLDYHDGRQIIQAVLALASSLKLTVVAEGVETDHHVASLRDMRCQCVQGFYYSRPLDVSSIKGLLAASASGMVKEFSSGNSFVSG